MDEIDQKGPFWVVYESLWHGIYHYWPKATLQVNEVPRISHKKFATFFEALDNFTGYCTFKSKLVSHEHTGVFRTCIFEIGKIAKQMFLLLRPLARPLRTSWTANDD